MCSWDCWCCIASKLKIKHQQQSTFLPEGSVVVTVMGGVIAVLLEQ